MALSSMIAHFDLSLTPMQTRLPSGRTDVQREKNSLAKDWLEVTGERRVPGNDD